MSTAVAQDPVVKLRLLHEEAINLLLQHNQIKQLMSENLQQTQFLMGGNIDVAIPQSIVPGTSQVVSAAKPKVTTALPKRTTALPKTTAAPSAASAEGTNSLSLKEVCWEILSRPENIEGLALPEVVNVIKNEGSWVSTKNGDDIQQSTYQTLYGLKKILKLARGTDKKFYIPEGVVSLE